jgi:hypothetical protein
VLNAPEALRKKLKLDGQRRLQSADDFIMVHHVLMREYGWIPLQEFRDMPIPAVWGLLEQIQKDKEAEKREYEKSKRRK